MKKRFVLKGLDCPNCAAKIEKDISDLNCVSDVSLNLIKQTLDVSIDDAQHVQYDNIYEQIKSIVHKYEPDAVMTDDNFLKKNDESEMTSYRLYRLIIGGIAAAVGIAAYYIFNPPQTVILPIILTAYLILGGDVLLAAGKNILRGRIFDENFLMALATLGAWAVGEYPEAAAVMLFYQIGEYFQDLAVCNSRRSISSLMDIKPDTANVLRDGNLIEVSPENVQVGEYIIVKPGEKVPLDGVAEEGDSMLDTRALTGESVPRHIYRGEIALSGCVNLNGALKLKVIKPFAESTACRIIDLVENASSRKAKSEQFITKFARYYTPSVVIGAALLAVLPPLLGMGTWMDCLSRACVFLVISCPCALVVSIPLTFFGGIGAASRLGILVKGGNYLEALNSMDMAVFDKTGTLTKGTFNVVKIIPAGNYTEYDVLYAAACAEELSDHPVAQSIRRAYSAQAEADKILRDDLLDYQEIAGHGTHVFCHNHIYYAGSLRMMRDNSIECIPCEENGTHVYAAKDKQYLGCIVIADEIKADSAAAIRRLKSLGIKKTIMLTGDAEFSASKIAKESCVDEFYAGLLPADKVAKIDALAKENPEAKIAFIGDGINDAPVLARADVGIAMGGIGSDAAIEAADVVLMTDEPSRIADAILIARRTRRIVAANIIFALSVKFGFLALGALGVIGMWPAVFADVGVMVLCVLNSMRMR